MIMIVTDGYVIFSAAEGQNDSRADSFVSLQLKSCSVIIFFFYLSE